METKKKISFSFKENETQAYLRLAIKKRRAEGMDELSLEILERLLEKFEFYGDKSLAEKVLISKIFQYVEIYSPSGGDVVVSETTPEKLCSELEFFCSEQIKVGLNSPANFFQTGKPYNMAVVSADDLKAVIAFRLGVTYVAVLNETPED